MPLRQSAHEPSPKRPNARAVGRPGEGAEPAFTLRLAPLCWSLGASKGRSGRPPAENAGPGHHDPAGSIKPEVR